MQKQTIQVNHRRKAGNIWEQYVESTSRETDQECTKMNQIGICITHKKTNFSQLHRHFVFFCSSVEIAVYCDKLLNLQVSILFTYLLNNVRRWLSKVFRGTERPMTFTTCTHRKTNSISVFMN